MNIKKIVLVIILFIIYSICISNAEISCKQVYDFNKDGEKEKIVLEKKMNPKTGATAILKIYDGKINELIFKQNISINSYIKIINEKIFVAEGRLLRKGEIEIIIFIYFEDLKIFCEIERIIASNKSFSNYQEVHQYAQKKFENEYLIYLEPKIELISLIYTIKNNKEIPKKYKGFSSFENFIKTVKNNKKEYYINTDIDFEKKKIRSMNIIFSNNEFQILINNNIISDIRATPR